jgi:hypothetical protein
MVKNRLYVLVVLNPGSFLLRVVVENPVNPETISAQRFLEHSEKAGGC